MALALVEAVPRKISDKPGYDVVTVRLYTPERLRAWRVSFGEQRNDRRLAGAGVVTGLDVCGPHALPLDLAPDSEIDTTFEYDDTGAPPDGDYTIGCHGLGEVDWI